ncbi:MAG: hypothetical protein HY909_10075 [Deltaproteobacteria bacterium]|nr:hypothetical protein [Deltaproteobacteria bacterium]
MAAGLGALGLLGACSADDGATVDLAPDAASPMDTAPPGDGGQDTGAPPEDSAVPDTGAPPLDSTPDTGPAPADVVPDTGVAPDTGMDTGPDTSPDAAPPTDTAPADTAPVDVMDAPRRCATDVSCEGDPGGPVCDVASGRCVPCLAARDRCPPSQHCDPVSNRCVAGCRADEGCPSGRRCDTSTRACVTCTTDSHCVEGLLCVAGACVAGCNPSRPCPGAQGCCAGSCVDVSSTVAHCGSCGRACSVPNATPACRLGVCGVGACAGGYADCDGNGANGCEAATATDDAHCGRCGSACGPRPNGTSRCAGGRCAVTCNGGFGDCDGDEANGCEASLATDPAHCGGCGLRPAEACNLRDDNCNGACDEGAGCRAGVHRSYNDGSGEHFYTRDRGEAACCGFRVENYDYFYLYTAPGAGLVPLYRCLLPRFHFYTLDPGCEGAGTAEGVLGYLSPTPGCGAVPLFRLYHSGGDHFYTVSEAERDSAARSGYVLEGTVGYVWPGG